MRYFLKCPYCGRLDPISNQFNTNQVVVCQSCTKSYWAQPNCLSKDEIQAKQMKLDDILSKSFKKPGGKTLKLEIAKDTTVANAVSDALEYLNHESNIEHNRIEFKYGRNYIVIAKLKDES